MPILIRTCRTKEHKPLEPQRSVGIDSRLYQTPCGLPEPRDWRHHCISCGSAYSWETGLTATTNGISLLVWLKGLYLWICYAEILWFLTIKILFLFYVRFHNLSLCWFVGVLTSSTIWLFMCCCAWHFILSFHFYPNDLLSSNTWATRFSNWFCTIYICMLNQQTISKHKFHVSCPFYMLALLHWASDNCYICNINAPTYQQSSISSLMLLSLVVNVNCHARIKPNQVTISSIFGKVLLVIIRCQHQGLLMACLGIATSSSWEYEVPAAALVGGISWQHWIFMPKSIQAQILHHRNPSICIIWSLSF